MTAAAPIAPTPRRPRFAPWFGQAGAATPPPAAEGDSRRLVDRRLFEEIGDFLAAHGLSPSPAHFEAAHAYITASDPRITREVTAMLAGHGTLDRDRFAALARPNDSGARSLAVLADQLEARLTECLSMADRSHISARDYGDALDVAQTRLVSDPSGTLDYIAGLTREVVTTTRLVESELQNTRRETERLRGDLDQARDAAERDHLTGLPNRRGLERRIGELIAAREGVQRVTIALCDIDDFKRVNDVHGHQAGDRVLKFVGKFLADELGSDAYVARHGGEEFAVVIVGRDPHEALALLDDARSRLAARSLVNQDTGVAIGRITFSAGLATLGIDESRAMGEADVALYRAKRGGKNAIVVASAAD